MPLYSQEKVTRLVIHLRKSVARLKELSKVPIDEFLDDQDKIGSAKYSFIVAIESCIDMANHIISKNGYRVPEDYGDSFVVMGEVGAIEKDFAFSLTRMAKFRNRLVHLYWEVDNSQVYEFMQTRINDFKIYLNAISSFLEWKNGIKSA